jgi:hypothetical protein
MQLTRGLGVFQNMKRLEFLPAWAVGLLTILVLSGCSDTTTVNRGNTSQIAHLEAGGLFIGAPNDTLVNFELHFDQTFNNSSGKNQHLFADWSIAEASQNKRVASGTFDFGVVAPGAAYVFDSIPVVALHSTSSALACAVTIRSEDGSYQSTSNGLIDSIPFHTRWRGVTFTTSASPTPIAIMDPPDDTDWIGSRAFTFGPVYPNPSSSGGTEMLLALPLNIDSCRFNLLITPHNVIATSRLGPLEAGNHGWFVKFPTIAPGLYRIVWTAYRNGQAFQSRGDVMIGLK